MNKKIILISLAVAVAASIAGWLQLHPASQALALSGNVDIRQVNLAFRVAGRLKTLRVDEGARVKAGDILGELDKQPYQIALDDANANHAALEARRSLYQQGYRKEDIAQAKATLNAREAALLNASQLLQRQKQLTGTGASSQRALDDAQSAYDQTAALAQAAREQFQALDKGYRKQEVAEAEANHQRSVAQVANAQLQLNDTVLTAPADGIILTRANEPGTILAAGNTVLTLSLTAPVWVRAYVAETDLGKVAPGTKVLVFSDSRTQPYKAVVGFVSPSADFTPKNVETSDLRTALVYRLRVIVEKPDQLLRQGMPVTVRLAQN